MTKKTWVKVKRGLLTDPRHRRTLGARIWLYLHIVDRANWDKGAVLEWRDIDEADALEMPIRTLREQRKQLQEDGYITCSKSQHSQQIVIHKWVNPRSYSGKVFNQSDKKPSLSKNESNSQSSSKHVAPSLSSHDQVGKKPKPKKTKKQTCPKEWMDAIYGACKMNKSTVSDATRKTVSDCGLALIKAGATIDDLRAFYVWHISDPWRKDHEVLTPKKIRDRWGQHNGQHAEPPVKQAKRKVKVFR